MHCMGQSTITWPPLAVGEAGKTQVSALLHLSEEDIKSGMLSEPSYSVYPVREFCSYRFGEHLDHLRNLVVVGG